MLLRDLENLKLFSQLSLKQVEDRLLITADFPKDFLMENKMRDPFLYVILYTRGGERIKIIDEYSAKIYHPTKQEIDPETRKKIVLFARSQAKQFRELTKE
ncbi:hypothetical protein H0266_02430 [Halobacillus locisalis]|uniref:Uncharacterized protein n=1 Tax=Halobacillus locisalis TaxID=220753 RepID=A0A838CNW3_9BACI|nr:hypothetical protein [Halobacillus locisalis]MBA2173747.1 hypothetical protein [Halobacillus locisalis]